MPQRALNQCGNGNTSGEPSKQQPSLGLSGPAFADDVGRTSSIGIWSQVSTESLPILRCYALGAM